MYGGLLTPEGARRATPDIELGTKSSFSPAVAVIGDTFLVVWAEERYTNNQRDVHVFGRRVDAGGAILDPSPIELGAGGSFGKPVVASSQGKYLVLWPTEQGMAGASLGATGNTPSAVTLSLQSPAQLKWSPSLAANETGYLLAWQDNRNGTTSSGDPQNADVYAARLDSNGVLLDAAGFAVARSAAHEYAPVAASDGTGFLVAWETPVNDADDTTNLVDVRAARITAAGAVLDADGFGVAAGADGSPLAAFLDWSRSIAVGGGASGYLVAWAKPRASGGDVPGPSAARVTAAGTVADPAGIALSPGKNLVRPAVVRGWGQDFFVEWDHVGTRISPAGTVLDAPPLSLRREYVFETVHAVAGNGHGYLLACVDDARLYVVRLDAAGQVLDPAGIDIVPRQTYAGGIPQVATDGDGYLVVWDQKVGTSHEVRAARVTEAGVVSFPAVTPLVARPHVVAATPEFALAPRAEGYLLAWQDGEALHAGSVSKDGVFLGPKSEVIATRAYRPWLARRENEYLLVWNEGGSKQWVTGRKLGARGEPLGPTVPLLSDGHLYEEPFPHSSQYGSVAASADGYLAIWNHTSSTQLGGFVPAGTALHTPRSFALEPIERGAYAASNGSSFLVVGRTSTGISGTAIVPGAAQRESIRIGNTAVATLQRPALSTSASAAAGPEGKYLVLYDAWDAALRTFRRKARLVELTGAVPGGPLPVPDVPGPKDASVPDADVAPPDQDAGNTYDDGGLPPVVPRGDGGSRSGSGGSPSMAASGGATSSHDAAMTPESPSTEDGCSCRTARGDGGAGRFAFPLGLGIALVLRRRRDEKPPAGRSLHGRSH